MSVEKVIMYGMGKHARKILSEYRVPLEAVEVIIDNSSDAVKKNIAGGGIRIVTWEEYRKDQNNFISKKVVVSSARYKEEITNQLLKSGLFQNDQIVYIDEWVRSSFYKGAEFSEVFCGCEKKERPRRVPALREDAFANAAVLSDRSKVLKRLPKNMIAAEVGVACGDFSQLIYNEMEPKEFYAIDIFDESLVGFWGDRRFEESGMKHQQWYENRFAKEIKSKKFKIRKGKSWEVLEEFPDDYFDYIYLDAAHDYESVVKDVSILRKKVKNGGIIQFNDYIIYDYNADVYYGVVQVVNQLMQDTRSEVLYYCLSTNGFDDIVIKYLK